MDITSQLNFKTLDFVSTPTRSCGGCQACCKLVPVLELNKPVGKRCRHQSKAKGCKIYRRRPTSCAAWNCAWLVAEGMEDFHRPDRAQYVIDIYYEFITFDGSNPLIVEALQLYAEPKNIEKVLQDKPLNKLIARCASKGIITLIRTSEFTGIVLIHPCLHPGDDMLRIDLDVNKPTSVEFDFAHLARYAVSEEDHERSIEESIKKLFDKVTTIEKE